MSKTPHPQEIKAWLTEKLAAELHVEPDAIDAQAPFTSLGIDSITAFTLTGDMAVWLDRDLPATLVWEYPSIEELSLHLAENT